MANLSSARSLISKAGFRGDLTFTDAAFNAAESPVGGVVLNPNLNALSDDILIGSSSAETLMGGKGDDILIGGAGGDRLDGGEGRDWASYATATARITLHLDGLQPNSGDASGDTFFSIENVMGSSFNDYIVGDNGDNVLSGLNGFDIIYAGAGNDVVFGDAGNDQLNAGAGNDTLNGGDDNDSLYGDGGDTLNGDAGNDFLFAGVRSDILNGGSGDDTLHGSRFGFSGDTTVYQMNGGDGNDMFFSGLGREAFNGGTQLAAGADHVSYRFEATAATINLQTGIGSGSAAGDTYVGIEWVTGTILNDTIIGSIRTDLIEGGAGNDTLSSGSSNDIDMFVYDITPTRASIEGTPFGPLRLQNIGHDVITDFDAKSSNFDQAFDLINFQGMTQAQFDGLHVDQVGNNTVITSNAFIGSITLQNFDADLWMQFG